jgi:hypothetical protein
VHLLQRVSRGLLARTLCRRMRVRLDQYRKEQEEKKRQRRELEEYSATTIQCAYRGHRIKAR